MPIPDSKAQAKQAPGGGEPAVAALLTWFVPGAGHLYLGKVRTAILAFVLIELLYLAGVMLSGGMFLEYLPAEMRTRFAAVLAPEMGNLGALLLHQAQYGYGESFPRPWPASMDLGTTLTAMSGLLNILLASHAHFEARRRKATGVAPIGPAVAATASFLIPGLGQVLQGRRVRGLLLFVCLVGLFFIGSTLGEGANLDRERHFYYWAGQFLLGLPAVALEFWYGHPRMTTDIAYADAGVVLGCVAGMLNVLGMLDAYGWSEAKILERPLASAQAPSNADLEESNA
ncbi:MAG: TM2 domain-containing membrane protein YozV [Planctomycetota bacterium]|jgi:TM2 domain-containing membrane protein YozV